MQNKTMHVYEIDRKSVVSRLEKEINYRISIEKKLRFKKNVLICILDTIDDPVIVVNEFFDIIFLNHLLETISGYKRYELTGGPVFHLIKSGKSKILKYISSSSSVCTDSIIIKNVFFNSKIGNDYISDLTIMPIEIENQNLFILKLKKSTTDLPDMKIVNRVEKISEAVHINHEKIKILKKSIKENGQKKKYDEFLVKFEELCTSFEALNHYYLEGEENNNRQRRVVAIRLMNQSIAYWKLATRKSKADLAVQSNLWKMYTTGDGFQRTQTLDKYFNITTLPKHPRWKKIIATAEFVLNASAMQIEERTTLESYLEKFKLLV